MGLGRYFPFLLSAVLLLLGGCERTDTKDQSAKESGDIKVAPYGSWQSPLSAAEVLNEPMILLNYKV